MDKIKVAEELVKIAKELQARSSISWEAEKKGNDIICSVTVSFHDEEDISDILDEVEEKALQQIKFYEEGGLSCDLLNSWSTTNKGISISYILYDGFDDDSNALVNIKDWEQN